MNQTESKVNQEMEQYYDSDNGYKFYDIINGGDYTGIGFYDEFVEEKREDGETYVRGSGITIAEATLKRDHFILNSIIEMFPADKQLKILELGTGRGGLSRFLTEQLLERGKLEVYSCVNISSRENSYNLA